VGGRLVLVGWAVTSGDNRVEEALVLEDDD
jgi:hypothetical protein